MPEISTSLGPVGRLIRLLLRQRVAAGPFAGMFYLKNSFGSAYLPKLLGTYEMELRATWKRLTGACRGGTLVNIGAAEGYYAVGALYRGSFERVVCFEQDARARSLLARLAQLSGIERGLDIRAQCDPVTLGETLRTLTGPVAILCDVEGYEDVLLDPAATAELARCHLLVELHEARCPGVVRRLRTRFQATHEIELIPATVRAPDDLPPLPWPLGWFPRRNKLRWLDELRDIDTPWFYLVPRYGLGRGS